MIRDYSLSPLSRPPPLLPPALPSIRLSFLFLFTTAPSCPLSLPRAPVSRPPLQGSGSGSHGGVSEPNFLFLSFSPPSPRMTNAYPPPPTPSLSLLLFVSGEFLGKFPPQPIYLSTYLSSYHFPLPSPLFPSLSSRARGARRHLPSPSAPLLALPRGAGRGTCVALLRPAHRGLRSCRREMFKTLKVRSSAIMFYRRTSSRPGA